MISPMDVSASLPHHISLSGVYGRRPNRLKLAENIVQIAGIEPGSALLEIGCGEGLTSAFLAEKLGCKVIGVDLELNLLSLAKQQVTYDVQSLSLEFCLSDAMYLPFLSREFDFIWCESTFSAFAEKGQALREFQRLLQPGGKLIILDFVLGKAVDLQLQETMLSLPCLGRTKTVRDYIDLFESYGFTPNLCLDFSEEVKKSGYWLSAMYGSLGEIFSRSTSSSCCLSGREKPLNLTLPAFQQFLREAKLGYELFVLSPCRK